MQDPKKPTSTLPEDKRVQLDSNIKKMISNGASTEDVKTYAADFKSKFAVKKKEDTTSEVASPKQDLESSGEPETTSSVTPEVKEETPKAIEPTTNKQNTSPVAAIDPDWKPGDLKRNSSPETLTDYNNWKAQSALTPKEEEEIDEAYQDQQDGWFGVVNTLTNWVRKKKSIDPFGIAPNPLFNPEAVTKAKTKDELVAKKIEEKRTDFLNDLDSPERREKVQTLVKVEKWQEDEKRIVAERAIDQSTQTLQELAEASEPLLSRKQELENIKLPEGASKDEVDALNQEYRSITSQLQKIQEQGQEAYASYEESTKAYNEHSENLGRFEDELGMLKKDFQFWSNAGNILGINTAEIASDLKFRWDSVKQRESRQALKSILKSGNVEDYADEVPAQYKVDGYVFNEKDFDEETDRLKDDLVGGVLQEKDVLNKQRDLLTPTVDAENINGVGDFIDFTVNGVLETTPTLIQLGMPYVGQASFFISQQANSELQLRDNIKADQEELLGLNDVFNNPGAYEYTEQEMLNLAKRKIQLEQQETPSDAAILLSSGAMASSELLLGRLGKIRLLNKAKRTAKSIGSKTLTTGAKGSYKNRLLKEGIDFGKDISGEGLEEFGVGVVGNIVDIHVLDRKYNEDGTQKNILDGAYGNTLGGLSTGGVISGNTKVLGYVAREVSDFKRRRAVVGNVKEINKHMQRLNDPDLTPELRSKIELEIQKINQKNGKIIKNVVEVYNGLNEKEHKQLIGLNNSISANEIAIEQLVKKGDADSDLVKSLTAQIETFNNAKAEILDSKQVKKESSALSLLPKSMQVDLKNEAQREIEAEYKAKGVTEYEITNQEIEDRAEANINKTPDGDTQVDTKDVKSRKKPDSKIPADQIVEDEVSTSVDLDPNNTSEPNKSQIKNETQTQGDTAPDGSVQPGVESSAQQGQDTTLQPASDATTSETKTQIKRINPPNVKGEYDVETDADGNVKSIKSIKTGKEISKFSINKKTGKPRKNAIYSTVEAEAKGTKTENAFKDEEKKRLSETLEKWTPSSVEEKMLDYFARGGLLDPESASKETGFTKKELQWVSKFGKINKNNSLPSIENLAEQLDLDNSQEARNRIIDFLGTVKNRQEVQEQVVSLYNEKVDEAKEQELNVYLSSLSPKELSQFEANKAEEDFISELSDADAIEYLEEQYGKQEEFKKEDGQGDKVEPDSVQERPRKEEENSKPESTGNKELDNLLDRLQKYKDDIDDATSGTLGINIAPAVAKAAITVLQTSLRAGKTIADAISDAVKYIKSTDWYKSLTKKEQNSVIDRFQTEAKLQTNNPKENREYVESVFDESDKEINKKKPASKRFRESVRKVIEKYSDRQFVAKVLIERSGMQSVKDLMINGHGSSGKAKRIYDKAYEDIYADKVKVKDGKVDARLLSQVDRKLLDKIIMLKRFIAIDKHRKKNNLPPVTHSGFINGVVAQDALNEYKAEVGDKKFKDLERRSKAYFDVYGKVLKDMRDNGLISEASYNSLNGVDYQPRQFLQHITDFEGNVSLGAAIKGTNDTGGLAKDQINSLQEGSEGALIRDSEWLLSTTIAGRYKAMAMNNVNKKFIQEEFPKAKKKYNELLKKPKRQWTTEEKRFAKYFKELDSKIKDNPVISVKENKDQLEIEGMVPEKIVKNKFDKAPPNFKKAYYYEDGVRKEFFIEENLHDSWFDNIAGLMNEDFKSFLQTASGSSLLKGIATGNNPSFPLVNTPRDFMFLATFSTEYSPWLPVAMYQVAKDSAKATRTIYEGNKKNSSAENLFIKYIEYGGDMTWLSTQGRLKEGDALNKVFNKIMNPRVKHVGGKVVSAVTLQEISTYSEMMFRIALMDRNLKNQLKDLGFKDISEVKDKSLVDEIYNRAVADARGILDFNQGGAYTKDLESVIPYLNTAVQGTRVMADAIRKDPVIVTLKMVQAGAIVSSASAGISIALISLLRDAEDEEDKDLSSIEVYLKATQGISKHQRIQYINFVTGRKNEDGQYELFKIAKSQPLTPALSLTDNIINQGLAKRAGVDPKDSAVSYSEIGMAINNNLAPIDISFIGSLLTDDSLIEGLASSASGTITRTPLTKAALTYATGYDFYREQDLTYDTDKDDPAMDGANDKNIEDFYKEFGRANRVSPARLKGAVESFITTPSTNPFVGMLYGGADYISASDGDLKGVAEEFWKTMQRSTTKRLVGYTSDFNTEINKMAPYERELKEISRKNKYELVDMKNDVRELWDEEITVKEFVEKLKNYDPKIQKKVANQIENLVKRKDIPREVISLKFETDKEVRANRIFRYYGDIEDPEFKSTEDFVTMVELKILDKETMEYYLELMKD